MIKGHVLLSVFFFIISLNCIYCYGYNDYNQNYQKILLKDVQVLTLHNGKMTTGRRSSPVAQINCLGSYCQYAPETLQCYNKGFDGSDFQWECKGDMSDDYKFGQLSVSCEGFDYPEDPYILAGSCGVEFVLQQTKAGKERENENSNGRESYQTNYHGYNTGNDRYGSSSTSTTIFTLVVIGIIIFVVFKACINPTNGGGIGGGNYGGGHYGGGGGGGGGGPYGPGCQPSYRNNNNGMGGMVNGLLWGNLITNYFLLGHI
eukprot:TRINITY_DN826_c0_g1_i2.p1 TRINITY_DN826_c0_g1~~TRINITY_DN826_c0_g1_i2.p1  ORF type:complete len:267 (-),score=88.74 TRINITY_DN826_c0_g1_i2:535-1314(-)